MFSQSWKVFTVIVLLMFGLSVHIGAQDNAELTAELPDFGSISYPAEHYSLRPDTFGIPMDRAESVLFPGAFSLTPNDSFIAEQAALGNIAYTLRMAAVVNSGDSTAADLATLFGQLPLLAYDADVIENLEVQSITVAGLPAVRVDNVPFAEDAVASHIIVLGEYGLIEIVIQPATRYGEPNHNMFMTGDAEANRALVEAMLASLTLQ